jgi:hypothetical protein
MVIYILFIVYLYFLACHRWASVPQAIGYKAEAQHFSIMVQASTNLTLSVVEDLKLNKRPSTCSQTVEDYEY